MANQPDVVVVEKRRKTAVVIPTNQRTRCSEKSWRVRVAMVPVW